MKEKILFFIKDCAPTEAEKAQAAEIDGRVIFRNASIKCEFPETCDAVAGCAPENYKALFSFVGTEEEKPKGEPKRGRKKKEEHERDGLQLDDEAPGQTPLIPAETGWKANS